MATLERLPEGVMIEILSKLPAKCVLRFKSVCKSWYALMDDPNFVRKHLSNSLHHNHVLLNSVVTNNTGKMENRFSILKFPFSVERSVSVTDVCFSFGEDFRFFDICGDSHGLICVSSDKDIFLCNPCTREIRKLPSSILYPTEMAIGSVGFGCDAKSEDFKVVRFVYTLQEPAVSILPRVKIYDLSKDRWREIENSGCVPLFWFPFFEICHQGTYYWWTKDEEGQYDMIEFDTSEEVFGRMSLPREVKEQQQLKCKSLGVLNGSIVLFNYSTGENENTLDIWEMAKNECGGGGVSWSKLLTIGPVFGIGMPFLFVSSDELLMEAAKEGQLILYNIKTTKFKELPIKGRADRFKATFVVESLVSVKGGRSNISYGF